MERPIYSLPGFTLRCTKYTIMCREVKVLLYSCVVWCNWCSINYTNGDDWIFSIQVSTHRLCQAAVTAACGDLAALAPGCLETVKPPHLTLILTLTLTLSLPFTLATRRKPHRKRFSSGLELSRFVYLLHLLRKPTKNLAASHYFAKTLSMAIRSTGPQVAIQFFHHWSMNFPSCSLTLDENH